MTVTSGPQESGDSLPTTVGLFDATATEASHGKCA